MNESKRERPDRDAYRERLTREVNIRCYVNLDREKSGEPYTLPVGMGRPGSLQAGIHLSSEITGEYGFWFPTSAHWIDQIPTHGRFELRTDGTGDNDHHVSEDSAILIGQTIHDALGDKRGVARAGGADWTFEGNVCHASLDISGRPDCHIEESRYGKFNDKKLWQMVYHFFRSLNQAAGIDAYFELRATKISANDHHLAELLYKCYGRALTLAARIDGSQVASTKGRLG